MASPPQISCICRTISTSQIWWICSYSILNSAIQPKSKSTCIAGAMLASYPKIKAAFVYLAIMIQASALIVVSLAASAMGPVWNATLTRHGSMLLLPSLLSSYSQLLDLSFLKSSNATRIEGSHYSMRKACRERKH